MSSPRIVLVEDNSFTRSTVAAALRSEGCIVDSLATAKEAVIAVSSSRPNCAVIDLHLGRGPSGIDVAHGLRELDPIIGIVLLTSFTDPRLLSEGQRELPAGTVYAVKNEINSAARLRECVDEAIKVMRSANVRAHRARDGRSSIGVPLTDVQVAILRLVAQGLTNAEIARRRGTSERTVEITIARTIKRLKLSPSDHENSRVLLANAYFELIGGAGAPG